MIGHFLYMRIVNRKVDDVTLLYRWRRFGTYLFAGLAIVLLLSIWLSNSTINIGQFLGLVSAGLAIAMSDTVGNLTGWLFIILRRPFEVGQRIEIDGLVGDVIDIRLFQFSVIEIGGGRVGAEQSTGRIVHVPNGTVLRQKLSNFEVGFGYIWDEIPMLVTFESDWEKARDIITEILNHHAESFSTEAENELRRAARRFMIFAGKLTPIVYTSIADSGVLLTMRFMAKPRTLRGIHQKISEDILREFAKHDDIDFAYPSIRYYDNQREGKPGARAPLQEFPVNLKRSDQN